MDLMYLWRSLLQQVEVKSHAHSDVMGQIQESRGGSALQENAQSALWFTIYLQNDPPELPFIYPEEISNVALGY